MTKLPQAARMGVGVPEVVDVYSSLCDAHPVASKHGIKRHFSELFPDSPSSDSPHITQNSRSPEKRKTACAPFSDSSYDSEQEEIAKRMCLECLVLPDTDGKATSSIKEICASRRRRFMRTAEALRQSGLLDITMKTAELLRKNKELQREIENLQKETRSFVLSVLLNPENRHILDNIHSGAQLYEVVVPGSQRIMSVSTHPADVNMNLTSLTLSNDMSNDSLSSHSNMSAPAPLPLISSSSDTTSMSNIESSEEENLAPPNIFPNTGH